MNNFIYDLSTKIYFGKGQIENLPTEIKKHGTKVLFLYGKNSIKKIGLYDEAIKLLNENNIEFVELAGVDPNPRLSTVKEGSRLCRENNLDFILAIGGGSTIDCAKAIAVDVFYEGDTWNDLYKFGKIDTIKKVLPVGSILTLAATGSEMNRNTVISNEETEEKYGLGCDLLKPKFSILDPTYTFSVPKNQTAAGCADILSHLFEQYFNPIKKGFVSARIGEAIMKTVIEYAPIALKEPDNYEARANLMWAGTVALNGTASAGKPGDWSVHGMEHELSAKYDITHGVGLAILTPRWMEYVMNDENVYRLADYARNVWGSREEDDKAAAKEGIAKTKDFFLSLGIPMTLKEVGINEDRLAEMAKKATEFYKIGAMKNMDWQDVYNIYKMSL